jgi:hypothetical protein
MNWQEGMKEELADIVDSIREILKDESEGRFVEIMDTVRAYAVVDSPFEYSENEVPPKLEGYPEAIKDVVENYRLTHGDISEYANSVLEALAEPNKNHGGGRRTRKAAKGGSRFIVYGSLPDGSDVYKNSVGFYSIKWNPKTGTEYKKYTPKSWKPEFMIHRKIKGCKRKTKKTKGRKSCRKSRKV